MISSSVQAAKYLKNVALSLGRYIAESASGEAALRAKFAESLAAIASKRLASSAGRILVDGTFDNEGYYFRLAFLIGALGGANSNSVGVLGRYKVRQARALLGKIGISEFASSVAAMPAGAALAEAQMMIAGWRAPEDILAQELPAGLPSVILYDYLLKRQRAAVVGLAHPSLSRDVADFLLEVAGGYAIDATYRPDRVLLSHVVTPIGASLAWAALGRGADVLLAFGNYGSARYCRMKTRTDLFRTTDCPSPADIEALPSARRTGLQKLGNAYIERRYGGKTSDIGGAYAFGARTHDTFDPYGQYGWSNEKPIVGIFASNWFDYPHGLGMTRFRDFAHWISATVDVAAQNERVNWLIRGHPCDAWYGGITVSQVLDRKLPPHIRICESDVSGNAIAAKVAAAVTFHGTVGVEYAAFGKQVLVADKGWYHDFPFCVLPRSREDYFERLLNSGTGDALFGEQLPTESERATAETFMAMYFCVPDWQAQNCVPDDSLRGKGILDFLRIGAPTSSFVEAELDCISAWLRSNAPHFHTFKMKNATSPALPH